MRFSMGRKWHIIAVMSQFNLFKLVRVKHLGQMPSIAVGGGSILLFRLHLMLFGIALAISLSACGAVRRPVLSEDIKKVRTAKQIKLEDKVQEFGNETHKFSLLPPKGFLYSHVDTSHGQVFTFSTPIRKDGRAGVFSVSCVANKPGKDKVSASYVLSSVLDSLARSCIDFHDGTVESFDVNGRSFVGAQFTGSYGGYYPIVGYLCVTPVPGGFYIVQWQDGEVHISLTKEVMLNSLKSMHIDY
ncbi:MAG: hypothetical protein Q8T09_04410 [Candidatus Melainabacteria bacterium]|nr:hypothetical protein [Candidatus Melainabacteria bacterium]